MGVAEGSENLCNSEFTHPLTQALRILLEGIPEHAQRITFGMYDILQYATSLGFIDSLDALKETLEGYKLFFVDHFLAFSDIENYYGVNFQSQLDAGEIIVIPLSFYTHLPEGTDGFYVFENKL